MSNKHKISEDNWKEIQWALGNVQAFGDAYLHIVGDGTIKNVNPVFMQPIPDEWEDAPTEFYRYRGVAPKFYREYKKSEIIHLRDEDNGKTT